MFSQAVTDCIFSGEEIIILPLWGKKRDLANNCSSWHKQDSCWKMLILQIVHSITGEVTALLYDDNSREGKKRSFPEGTSRCRENNLHAEFPL